MSRPRDRSGSSGEHRDDVPDGRQPRPAGAAAHRFRYRSERLAGRPRRPAAAAPRPALAGDASSSATTSAIPARHCATTSRDCSPTTASTSPAAGSSCSPTPAPSATCSTRSAFTGATPPTARLVAVVAEVHNTYGDRHAYVLRPDRGRPGRPGPRQADVCLAVQPRRRRVPDHRVAARRTDVSVTVTLTRDGQPPFVATAPRRPARDPPTSASRRGRDGSHLAAGQRSDPLAGRPPVPSRPSHRAPTDPRAAGGSLMTTLRAGQPRRPRRRPRPLAGDGRPRAVADARPRSPQLAAAAGRRPHRYPRRRSRTGRRGAAATRPTMRVLDTERFFTRLGRDGLIGFGESYMAGDWDSDELVALLTPMARDMGTLVPPRAAVAAPLVQRAPPAERGQRPPRRAAQHRPALRPVERPVRHVPRRDDDVLRRRCSSRPGDDA